MLPPRSSCHWVIVGTLALHDTDCADESFWKFLAKVAYKATGRMFAYCDYQLLHTPHIVLFFFVPTHNVHFNHPIRSSIDHWSDPTLTHTQITSSTHTHGGRSTWTIDWRCATGNCWTRTEPNAGRNTEATRSRVPCVACFSHPHFPTPFWFYFSPRLPPLLIRQHQAGNGKTRQQQNTNEGFVRSRGDSMFRSQQVLECCRCRFGTVFPSPTHARHSRLWRVCLTVHPFHCDVPQDVHCASMKNRE